MVSKIWEHRLLYRGEKAENLLAAGRYTDVMSYMLEKGKKLEQEIVSWMEWKGVL